MKRVVSSVRIFRQGAHDTVAVWSRGGRAGTLTVSQGDGPKLAAIMAPVDVEAAEACLARGEDVEVLVQCDMTAELRLARKVVESSRVANWNGDDSLDGPHAKLEAAIAAYDAGTK